MGDIAGKVLVVDDLAKNTEMLQRALERKGYQVRTAHDGASALDVLAAEAPDIVLLDILMPGMDGFEVCRRIKANPATRLTPVVLVTGLGAREDRIRGIEAGADDFLTKPPALAELTARVRSLVRLKRFTDELESAESMVVSLAMTIEARDAYTEGHCERLARFATALGQQLGLDDADLAALYRGGYLHDVGKVAVPDAVLLKEGPLSEQERVVMQRHPIVGDRLCSGLRSLQRVRPIVRHHHERLDGTGYPDRLAGAAIPLLAQIIAIVDVFDALTTVRPYRRTLTTAEASEELLAEAGRGWLNGELVREFNQLVERGGLPAEEADPELRARYAHPRADT
jgi:putative two-component system response regulator